MAKKKTSVGSSPGVDDVAGVIYVGVTESGANTLTFQKLETGHGVLDNVAWMINRIEYYIAPGEFNKLAASDDIISLALTTSNTLTSLSLADSGLVDLLQYQTHVMTAVGYTLLAMPLIRDFTHLPGGGRMVLPQPLFLGIKGTSLATALTASARIFFTSMTITPQEWQQLVAQTRLLS